MNDERNGTEEERIINDSEEETDIDRIDDDPFDEFIEYQEDPKQNCFLLEIRAQSDAQTTTDKGYEPDNPLVLVEGTYQLSLKLVGADLPCKYPESLHFKLEDSDGCKAIFSNYALHDVAVVFKSDDSTEKSKRTEVVTVNEHKMDLGRHKMLPGRLSILVIGNLCLDVVEDDGVYEGDSVPLFVQYWLRVLHKPTRAKKSTS